MKYWSGYITAAIFGAISWGLMQFGEKFTVLVDMIYPYVTRTAQDMLAVWSGSVDYCIWQILLLALLVVLIATVVIMIICRWNILQWAGWVLAAISCIFMLHTAVFGLNRFTGPISEDIRLEEQSYTVEELTNAAAYYRDQANELASQVQRDGNGDPVFADFDALADQAGNGFHHLVYERSYPVFAGSTEPVKKLGWADLLSSMGISGMTMGLTGEAAVNPNIPAVALPFTMCREMARRMCIVTERDANFAGFLAAAFNDSIEFQYSAYFTAYRYCYEALVGANTQETSGAAARIAAEVSPLLSHDLQAYDLYFDNVRDDRAAKVAETASDTYLKASGEEAGIASYGAVCDLLVAWHYQEVVLPTIKVEEHHFDPFDESQVDLSGIVNADPEGVG